MNKSTSRPFAGTLQKARRGDPQVLAKLLETYRSYLRLLARVQIHKLVQARVSPSDIVQESMLAAQAAFPGFVGHTENELLAWLRKVLASRLVDALRFHSAERRDVRHEQQLANALDESSAQMGQMLQLDKSPSEIAIRREESILLSEALDRLPRDYAEVIIQHHLEGRSFPEIATELSRTVPSVKGLWARAMTKLRTEFGETNHE